MGIPFNFLSFRHSSEVSKQLDCHEEHSESNNQDDQRQEHCQYQHYYYHIRSLWWWTWWWWCFLLLIILATGCWVLSVDHLQHSEPPTTQIWVSSSHITSVKYLLLLMKFETKFFHFLWYSLLWEKIKQENFNVDWRCCELNETFKKFDEYLNWAVLLMLSANTPHLIFDHQHFFIFKTNSCNFFFLFRFNCSPDTTSFTWFKDNSKLSKYKLESKKISFLKQEVKSLYYVNSI